jgi:nicotinamide riboside kinase
MCKSGPRIAIDGAQSTGKSTLLQALFPTFHKRLTFITEASREIAPRFSIECERDWHRLLGNKKLLEEFFAAEEQWQADQQAAAREGFVIDSSLMLTWAYRRHFLCEDPADSRFTGQYDLVLYCPPGAALSRVDGFRFLTGREAIDMRYREIVKRVLEGVMVTLPIGVERLSLAVAEITKLID